MRAHNYYIYLPRVEVITILVSLSLEVLPVLTLYCRTLQEPNLQLPVEGSMSRMTCRPAPEV